MILHFSQLTHKQASKQRDTISWVKRVDGKKEDHFVVVINNLIENKCGTKMNDLWKKICLAVGA